MSETFRPKCAIGYTLTVAQEHASHLSSSPWALMLLPERLPSTGCEADRMSRTDRSGG